MSDGPHISSLRSIYNNTEWMTNWLTSIAFAGLFSIAASTLVDKLTFTSILVSFFVACLLDSALWPLVLIYVSDGLVPTIVLAMVCGLGGFVLLLTLISIIRKYIKEDGPRIIRNALKIENEGKSDV